MLETGGEKREALNEAEKKTTVEPVAEKKSSTDKPSEDKETTSKDKIQREWPDLKKLIGINQKFQVVGELFKGSQKEFDEAVSQINALYNKEEALIYVQGLKAAFSWKDDSTVAEEFIKTVMNRYN
jgi:hypothetical protein